MTKKQPVSGGATGRMKKSTVATKSPSVKDTFGVSDADLKTWWYHPYSKRGLEINKQIKKKIGSRALTNLVVFSMDSASKGQKADSAAFKYVKGLTKFTRKNLKVDAMKQLRFARQNKFGYICGSISNDATLFCTYADCFVEYSDG